MPFCHFTLKGRKPLPEAYPTQLATLGDHLRKRRLDLGLLQKELAQRLAVHENTVNGWETNRTTPPLRFVPRIIAFLGYTPRYTTPRTLEERTVVARRLLGLTQKDLAHRLGINPSTLGRWETGKGRPSRKLLQRLTAFLYDPQAKLGE